MNTGLLCDGLRAIDIDIDDRELSATIRADAVARFGETIIRSRSNSGRCLLLYRAHEGSPDKTVLSGQAGKIEVLGHGQQFVAFGTHHTGAPLHWFPEAPGDITTDALPTVTENAIGDFLQAAAPLIKVRVTSPPSPFDGVAMASSLGPSADPLDVVAALAALPNTGHSDWEHWNRIGMAAWAASSGSTSGFAAWCAWSEQHSSHDPNACRERWAHYPTSPPTQIGAGTLFRLAQQSWPGWTKPTARRRDETTETPPDFVEPDSPERVAPGETTALRGLLSIEAWAARDIPEPDYLLGNLITTTSRAFLVGRTGLGKTMLALAIAVGAASGRGFLNWRSSRPARVLYIDGEMPAELIKARAVDALRRAAVQIPHGNLVIYGRDIEEEISRQFPTLGTLAPLNTEQGRNFVHALIAALGGVDLVIFDNVMSLVAGDQKDEVPWAETMPLVQALTGKRIGQLWLDHTGHNQDRQYGSSTKAWRFDAVGNMAPLPEAERDSRSVGFTLSFDPPGKARRRTPENWREFAPCKIRLADDMWTVETTEGAKPRGKLSPKAKQFYHALMDAFAISPTPGQTTRSAWYAECVRTGLADQILQDEDYKVVDRKQASFRKYLFEIKTAGWFGMDGERIFDRR